MEHPPKHHKPKEPPIFKEEAAEKISQLIMELANAREPQIDEETGEPLITTLAYYLTQRQPILNFYVNKLVEDVLAYCHRRDFPPALIYTCVDAILKLLENQVAAENSDFGTNAPLSEIRMDDTTFKFSVSSVDLSAIASEQLFSQLKSKLNLFRKIKAY